VFGFPAAEELPLKARNLGFLDQRLALDWVQRNIDVFGGDPDKGMLGSVVRGQADPDSDSFWRISRCIVGGCITDELRTERPSAV
jgi:Carboxylesterase family